MRKTRHRKNQSSASKIQKSTGAQAGFTLAKTAKFGRFFLRLCFKIQQPKSRASKFGTLCRFWSPQPGARDFVKKYTNPLTFGCRV
jgi:hypothetical protein